MTATARNVFTSVRTAIKHRLHLLALLTFAIFFVAGCPSGGVGTNSPPDDPIEITIVGLGAVEQSVNGDTVTLTAIPDEGWEFSGWSGANVDNLNPLTVDANDITSISANFVETQQDPPTTAPVDRDDDGVPDDVDLCEATPAGQSVDDDGCSLSQRDSDRDGVSDADDECPGTPQFEFVNEFGCGPSHMDTDEDGVLDGGDGCLGTDPGLPVDSSGCAENQRDADSDGVTDDVDQCPDTPTTEDAGSDGCSVSQVDLDGDGVPLQFDLCPHTPPGQSVDSRGCALSQIDSDFDGVKDDVDQCADTPPSTVVDAVGCPLPVCGNDLVEDGETCDPPACNTCDAACQTITSEGEPTWTAVDVNGEGNETETGALSGVWGSGPGDVFVVGGSIDQLGNSRGEIYHYNGSQWSTMSVPPVPLLNWVFGFSSTDVYAVGLGGSAVHYDGSNWTSLETGTTLDLWGIWGSSPSDIWIVGGNASSGEPLILRYDGVSGGNFTEIDLPSHNRPDAHALFKVWGIGSKVFAVGQRGLILEYADGSWSHAESGVTGFGSRFISLWGTDENNIVAVGGFFEAKIAHYDGSTWTTDTPAGIGGLNAVFMAQPNQAIVGGVNTTAFAYDVPAHELTEELSGSGALEIAVHAIWSDCNGRHYAVGGFFNPPFTGLAFVRTIE